MRGKIKKRDGIWQRIYILWFTCGIMHNSWGHIVQSQQFLIQSSFLRQVTGDQPLEPSSTASREYIIKKLASEPEPGLKLRVPTGVQIPRPKVHSEIIFLIFKARVNFKDSTQICENFIKIWNITIY